LQTFLIQRKDRGGLIYPSKDLVKVCEISEKKIRETINNHNLFYNKNILHYLCVKVISTLTTQHPEILKNANHEAMHKYELLNLHSPLKVPAKEKNQNVKKNGLCQKLSNSA